MNKIALPKIPDRCIIGTCDICECNDAMMSKGNGVYYKEICSKCRIRSAHEFY